MLLREKYKRNKKWKNKIIGPTLISTCYPNVKTFLSLRIFKLFWQNPEVRGRYRGGRYGRIWDIDKSDSAGGLEGPQRTISHILHKYQGICMKTWHFAYCSILHSILWVERNSSVWKNMSRKLVRPTFFSKKTKIWKFSKKGEIDTLAWHEKSILQNVFF